MATALNTALLFCFVGSASAIGHHSVLGDEHSFPAIGNYALSTAQQPGPFISFGQDLVDKGQFQLNVNSFYSQPVSFGLNELNASFIYGISDITSLFFNLPLSSGPGSGAVDPVIQLEHAFYARVGATYQDQATIVGMLTLPMSDVPTSNSYGSSTYFLGTTLNRTYFDWQFFVSPGILTTTQDHAVQVGAQYVYEAGIGRNLSSETGRYIFFGLLELDGQYTKKGQTFGPLDTGGNSIFLTPSLWFSTPRWIIQAGVGVPLMQQVFGNQTKTNYYAGVSVSWTFEPDSLAFLKPHEHVAHFWRRNEKTAGSNDTTMMP